MATLVSWKAKEHERGAHTSDWYWAVWIIVLSIAATAVLFNDVLLAVLVVLGAFTLTLMAARPARTFDCAITSEGIRAGSEAYLYDSLQSFWVAEEPGLPPRLLVVSKRLFVPLLAIPLGDADPAAVRAALDGRLLEKKIEEPFMQKLLEYLGF